ncbi:trypsin CFT-1-like [Maniola jurtina]|uniref:trypsin CFT-1-like n=1 Tax=Maniola jurtina TaxID=191418 RepID=UPI001E6872FC|nr:trypsin CFT-1-like [Maniola jurtina]
MWKLHVLLAICLATAEALPQKGRIVGGSVVNISQYPFAAVLLVSYNNAAFRQDCGGLIINNRSIMSAAHCWVGKNPRFAVRVGSTNANSGGAFHYVARHITHPNYNIGTFMNNDIGIVRLSTAISFGNNVRAGAIAGSNFNVPNGANVWSIGWGLMSWGGQLSEQLRHVQLRTVSQSDCQRAYVSNTINDNMLCAGWHTDGRGSCTADSGTPLLLSNTAVGVTSFGTGCGEARWPGVYARVSRYTSWIQANA